MESGTTLASAAHKSTAKGKYSSTDLLLAVIPSTAPIAPAAYTNLEQTNKFRLLASVM
jgi:hypothetical protein